MLRYLTSTVTACAIAGTITLFAQEPAPSQPQAQQPPSQSQAQQPAAPPSATLTGCVQEAKTTDGGKAFVLNNAEGGTAKMYLLIGQTSTDLSSQVNHKVEVTGQVQEPKAPSAADEGAKANPNVVRPPAVQVASVKMVAESCK
jgi:hypothetical protein